MPELTVELNEQEYKALMSFKKVYDEIMEKEEHKDLNTYLRAVISRGINKMMWDIIPQDMTVLRNTIDSMQEVNPEFVAEFIAQALREGEVKQKAREKLLPYE